MDRFPFGKNWEEFLERYFSQERVEQAKRSLLEFLELPTLEGLYSLDIGCGSGLFSLAAYELGASKIISFDIDPFSVRCCQRLWGMKGNPKNWEVMEGDILNEAFVSKLEPADIVYSWGVLHHTGNMWKAIERAGSLVKPGGLFYIALYNKRLERKGSRYWLKVKKRYNKSPMIVKRIMELTHIIRYTIIPQVIRLKNPFEYVKNYDKTSRGMGFYTDLKDWLGGLPYEFATVCEVFRFCHKKLGFKLKNLKSAQGLENNEFLFVKTQGQ
ncbi:TPA: class I SAM-dependent methyltransferase [bacterium]|nr:class I SAM-dependent methyltransferase [bacterium]